jgi:hypothetical protein
MDKPSNQDLVRDFLRAQNFEQVGRVDEAIPLYEQAVSAGFDAAGPYDRLIFIYTERRMHSDVIRVAKASLELVRTYAEKRDWYERQIDEAQKAMRAGPTPI